MNFTFARASDQQGAVTALGAQAASKLIAGGTNLIDLVKYEVERPAHLIDITRLPGLDAIEETESGLRIGALVRNSTCAYDARVERGWGLLSHAILAGATPQLRNMATTGGNLLQRTRCYYFYDTATPCNKREPGSGCPALTGVNRIHAILGASGRCIATHPSDMCVGLAALDAVIHVMGPAGERTIQIGDFHRLPGDAPERDTTLGADELITAVTLPANRFGRNFTYLKLRDRHSYAFALVSVAAALEMEDGIIRRARLALGGVAHKPWRVPEAEALLEGQGADAALFARVADRVLQGAQGHGGNDFKIGLAHRAIGRALAQAAAGTPQSIADKRIA